MNIKDKNKEVTGYNDFIIQKDNWLKKAKTKEKAKVEAIRKGFVETVVVFIDMVDSTKFKIEYKNQPQKWINKVYQFSSIVKTYVEGCHGTPVKYIGDEVMAVFKGKSKIKDALNFLMRINDLEKDISDFTKSPTKVKVSVDYGNVYSLNYQGHNEPDPQGTPVDRCARIAKHCKAGTILSSADFRIKCDENQVWSTLGQIDLKGIGKTEIFQYGKKTVELQESISEEELDELRASERVCELLDDLVFDTRAIAPNAKQVFVWEKKVLAHNYIISGKYGVTVDVDLKKSPYKITVFGRDNAHKVEDKEATRYFWEEMCNNSMFLPASKDSFDSEDGRLVFKKFEEYNPKLIAKSLKDILERIENYIQLAYPKPKGYFQIFNKASGKVIDVKGYSLENGGLIYMFSSHGGDNQLWEFSEEKKNLFSITGKQSNKCLEVKNAHDKNSTEIIQNTYNGKPHQLWRVISNSDDSYYIMPHHTDGKYLEQDAETVLNEPGRLIQHESFVHDKYSRNHQKWILKQVIGGAEIGI